MTHDVKKWVSEIRLLKKHVSELSQERDEAYRSAASWRALYETEAKQRREDAEKAKQSLEQLQEEIRQLHAAQDHREHQSHVDLKLTLQKSLDALAPEEMRNLLIKALVDCDRLQRELKAEQSNHTQTRQTLMNALGDTVDLLTKERLTSQDKATSSAL